MPRRSSLKNPAAPRKAPKRVYFVLPAEAPRPFKPTASDIQKLLFNLNRASTPMDVLNVFHSYTRLKRWETVDDTIAGLTAHVERLPKSMRMSQVGGMKHAVYKSLIVDLDWSRDVADVGEEPKMAIQEAFEDTWMSIRYGTLGQVA